jgi:hypothetical protein
MTGLGFTFWLTWAVVLLLQNISFTFNSRARNSASKVRHAIAAIFSNGVWFVSQLFAINTVTAILTGHLGLGLAILAGVFYTTFTVLGAMIAHTIALRTEKGKSAVGANSKYAQITTGEWEQYKRDMDRIVNGFDSPKRNIVMEGVNA